MALGGATESMKLRPWRGSGRLSRRSWLEPRIPCTEQKARAAPPPASAGPVVCTEGPDQPIYGSQIATRREDWVVPPEDDALQPVLFGRLESQREALERSWAAKHLATALLRMHGVAGTKGPVELLAERVAEVSKLEVEVDRLNKENRTLEDALAAVEKRADEEKIRADAKANELQAYLTQRGPPVAAYDHGNLPGGWRHVDAAGALALTPLPETSPRAVIDAIRHERMSGIQSPVMRDMFLGCIELLSADIYSSPAHFILELLQNADDNDFPTSCNTPTACFHVCGGDTSQNEPPYILVANNESGLKEQDVHGLCAISKSSKTGKSDRTGRKGIGFKSVFAVSACPHVLSGPYAFKFDVQQDRMGYVTPTWLEDVHVAALPQLVRDMHQQGFTCIYLPLAPEACHSGLLADVQRHLDTLDPTTLLFFRRLRKVEIHFASGQHKVLEHEGREEHDSGLARESIRVTSTLPAGKVAGAEGRKDASHKFFVVRKCPSVEAGTSSPTLALPIYERGVPLPMPVQHAFATLPLCHTGLAVAINADWDVSASRDGVHENAQNEQIVKKAALMFAEAVSKLGGESPALSPIHYLGGHTPLPRFWRRAREAFLASLVLLNVPCITIDTDEGGREGVVGPSFALRRLGPNASGAELAAMALTTNSVLRKIGKGFAKEPLPLGIRLETFSLRHFAECIPHIIEGILAVQEFEARVCALAEVYAVFLSLLEEPPSDPEAGVTVEERAKLARTTPIFPIRLCTGGGRARPSLCALQEGPIFMVGGSGTRLRPVEALLPSCREEAARCGRLRVLLEEASEALPLAARPRWQSLGLRPGPVERAHVLGLCLNLHEAGGSSEVEDMSAVWASLELIRDALEDARDGRGGTCWTLPPLACQEVHAQSNAKSFLSTAGAPENAIDVANIVDEALVEPLVDPLIQQGLEVLAVPRGCLAGLLFIPTVNGCLQHAGVLVSPSLLGISFVHGSAADEGSGGSTALGGMTFAALPPRAADDACDVVDTIRWERFFVQELGLRPPWLEALDPAFQLCTERLAQQLLNVNWWLDVLEKSHEPAQAHTQLFVLEVVEANSDMLGKLSTGDGGWAVRDYLSADFSYFLHGLRLGGLSPPLLPDIQLELPAVARACLTRLGIVLQVDDAAIVNRCLPLLVRAGPAATLEHFSRAYGALICCQGLVERLSQMLYVPGSGIVDSRNCLFLPEHLQGFAELLGRYDLRPWYPKLHHLFVNILGLPHNLSVTECVAGLRVLRDRYPGPLAPSDAATCTVLATSAYRQILVSRQAEGIVHSPPDFVRTWAPLSVEPLLWVPYPWQLLTNQWIERGRPLGRWCRPCDCMWMDLPAAVESRKASLQPHFPVELKDFFVGMIEVVELDVEEVSARMPMLGDHALGASYLEIDLACRNLDVGASNALCKVVGNTIRVPGSSSEASDHCAFLPKVDLGFAKRMGRLNLAFYYPELREFFVRRLHVKDSFSMEDVVRALRVLPMSNEEKPQALMFSALELLNDLSGMEPAAKLRRFFEEDALLYVPPSGQTTRDRWLRSSSCMWYDLPAGVEVSHTSLEPHYPPHLRAFLVERLGVAELVLDEVRSRLTNMASEEALCVNGALQEAYCKLSRRLASTSGGEEEQFNASLDVGIFIPGQPRPVRPEACIYISDEEGTCLSQLLGKINLGSYYSHCRSLFVDHMGVQGDYTIDECIAALRELRARSDDADIMAVQSTATAIFQEMARACERRGSQHGECLGNTFTTEPLLLVLVRAADCEQKQASAVWQRISSCMWADLPSGVEVYRSSLASRYPAGLQRFFTESIGLVHVDAAEVLARVQQLTSATRTLAAHSVNALAETTALRAAYAQIDHFCRTAAWDAGSTLHRELAAVGSVLASGNDFVLLERCVYLGGGDGPTDLAALVGVTDLQRYYPELRCFFVDCLGVRDCLTEAELFSALRMLRDAPAGRFSDEETLRLSVAVYTLFAQQYESTPRIVDLMVVFEEEPLLFVRAGRWVRNSDCMWHDAPAQVEAQLTSLERHYPPKLQSIFVEVLGVVALHAAEVASRLEMLFTTRRNVTNFAHAYSQIYLALIQRQRDGIQFHNVDLLAELRHRIFLPAYGLKVHSECVWQESPTGIAVAITTGRDNLYQVYTALEEDLTHDLKAYFVDLLGVRTNSTIGEVLEALRIVKQGSASDGSEGALADTVRLLYGELACAAQSIEAHGSDADALRQAFKQDALLHVPDCIGGVHCWLSVDQCIWSNPKEAPEGWTPTRIALSLYYGDDASLTRLFTEYLGVPMSVRFSVGKTTDQALVSMPFGQPVWLFTPMDGKKMVALPLDAVVGRQAAMGAAAPAAPARAEAAAAQPPDAVGSQSWGHSTVGPEDVEAQLAAEHKDDALLQPGTSSGEAQRRGESAGRYGGSDWHTLGPDADVADVPPPPQPLGTVRGVASDGRKDRRRLLKRLAAAVLTTNQHQMNTGASRLKHKAEECHDCNPQHDLDRLAKLEGRSFGGREACIPVWVEREGKQLAIGRLKYALEAGILQKFAGLLVSLAGLFDVPCMERVHIFEEDSQTVAFNGGALFFNLRYFVTENHAESWEDAVCFWTISFAHELAHFESVVHDRQHGRAMENAQRAMLPGLPDVLGRPWGVAEGQPPFGWSFRQETRVRCGASSTSGAGEQANIARELPILVAGGCCSTLRRCDRSPAREAAAQ